MEQYCKMENDNPIVVLRAMLQSVSQYNTSVVFYDLRAFIRLTTG